MTITKLKSLLENFSPESALKQNINAKRFAVIQCACAVFTNQAIGFL